MAEWSVAEHEALVKAVIKYGGAGDNVFNLPRLSRPVAGVILDDNEFRLLLGNRSVDALRKKWPRIPAATKKVHLALINDDDKMIQAEGVSTLTENDREDCRDGGLLGLLSVEEMRQQKSSVSSSNQTQDAVEKEKLAPDPSPLFGAQEGAATGYQEVVKEGSSESESLSDIDNDEVEGYLHNEEDKHYKEMNKEYIEEQAAAAAAEEAVKNCPVEARKLADEVAKSKMPRDWLDLSLKSSVPSSLLILPRAFNVSGEVRPEEAVQATLSSLPDEVVDTVRVTAFQEVASQPVVEEDHIEEWWDPGPEHIELCTKFGVQLWRRVCFAVARFAFGKERQPGLVDSDEEERLRLLSSDSASLDPLYIS